MLALMEIAFFRAIGCPAPSKPLKVTMAWPKGILWLI